MKLVVVDLGALPAGKAERALPLLPAERSAEIIRCRWERDRARSIVAEAAVRLEIMRTLHIPNGRIRIVREGGRKPYLDGFPSFFFNLSHSGNFCVCATDGFPVGVDVEKLRPIDLRPIVQRCFSPCERAEIGEAQSPLSAFFRLWTAKESAVKQRGTGLAAELKRLEVSGGVLLDGSPLPCDIFSYGLRSGEAALLSVQAPEADHICSVCASKQSAPPPQAEFFSAGELLNMWIRQCK